jgi:hypothetical protein
MTPSEIYALIHFDGYDMPKFIPNGPTQRAWTNMNRAIIKGARWGDFAVYNRQELEEVLEERGPKMPMPIATSTPILDSFIERSEPVITYTMPAVVSYEAEFKTVKSKTNLREKLDKFLTPKNVRPLCLGCGMYCVHSKPPDNWSAGDRKRYCCLDCRDSGGKKHAHKCQKHK